jgi:preprotein translocase subunit SecB
MSDDTIGNGPAGPPQESPTATPPPGQQLIINFQYIKDLSFENPRLPRGPRQQQGQPSVDINVDVKAQALGPDAFEVILTINASAKQQDEALFLIELAYGAVVTVRNVPQEMLSPFVLVETPRLIFPFARAIIAETTRDGGFPPLMINPIDFADLLRRKAAAAAGAAAGSAGA